MTCFLLFIFTKKKITYKVNHDWVLESRDLEKIYFENVQQTRLLDDEVAQRVKTVERVEKSWKRCINDFF